MKSRFNPFLRNTAAVALALAASVHAEILNFNGNQATGVTTHTLNATDWADYVGGNGTFNSANAGGRLYWRGSAGDGQFMHFDLSSLTGLTLVAPVTVTLQDSNPTHGGGVDGSFVATADTSWTAGGNLSVPASTPIANAVNATGSYGWDASISWGIGYSTFQGFVDNQSGFYGLGVIGGSGSQMHFDAVNPYLTVQTGTLTTGTVITADTGSATWNAANYNFAASGDAYNPIKNTLTISGELAAGTSGAGTVTINNGGTVAVSQAGSANYYWALDGTTINAGGKLTSNGHSHIHNLTLAGGELASTGTDGTYGGWTLDDATTVTGGVTSTISAQQLNLDSGVFNVDTGSTLNFSGSTRSGSLTKNGAGSMVITGYQNYAGGTTINNGTLEVVGQNSGYGWLRGAVTVNAGGTLRFTGGDGTGFGWNSPVTNLTINGGTFDAPGSAHIGFGSYITVGLNNGGTISGSGQWNGDGLLGFSSSGDSTNTFSGTWNLRGDNGVDHTFTVNDGAAATDLLVSANFSNTYSVAIVKAGAGTMKLTGNSSYYGQTRVNAGTLVAASNGSLGPGGWDGNTMTWVYDGATLALEGGISLNEHMHVYGAGVGGNGAIRSLSGNNALTLTYGGGGSGPGFSIDSNTTIGVDADTLTATGFYESGGSWGLTKVGEGTLKLTQESWHTGGTTVNEGTLVLDGGNGGNARVRGALTVNNGTSVIFTNDDGTGLGWNGDAKATSLTINGGTVSGAGTLHVWNLAGGVNMTGGTLQSNNGTSDPNGPQLEWLNANVTTNASADTATIGGRIRMRADGGATGITFTVADGDAAADLLVSAAVTEASGGLGITKSGAGTMVLSGANNYTGATTVSAGTLLVTGALGDSAVSVNGGAFGGTGTVGGSLTINSGFFHIANLFNPLDVTGTVTLYSGFGVDDLAGINWSSVVDGTYTLINGTLGSGVFTGLANNSLGTAFDLGGGRSAYFQEGSLELVVIPEPRAALLGGLGMLALLRRRRA